MLYLIIPLAAFIFIVYVLLYSEHTDAGQTLCTFGINFADKEILLRSDYMYLRSHKGDSSV